MPKEYLRVTSAAKRKKKDQTTKTVVCTKRLIKTHDFYGHPYTNMKFQNIQKGSFHPPYLRRMQDWEADPVIIMILIQQAI